MPSTRQTLLLYLCIIFTTCIAFLLYLDDVTNAYCVYTQFSKNILTFLSFFYLLTCTVSLHPFTKIPVRNDKPPLFSICIRDVIQAEQKCYACFQKWYTSILLSLWYKNTHKQTNTRTFCIFLSFSQTHTHTRIFLALSFSLTFPIMISPFFFYLSLAHFQFFLNFEAA